MFFDEKNMTCHSILSSYLYNKFETKINSNFLLRISGRKIENLQENVKIGSCNKPPCKLKKKTTITVEIKFKPGKKNRLNHLMIKFDVQFKKRNFQIE